MSKYISHYVDKGLYRLLCYATVACTNICFWFDGHEIDYIVHQIRIVNKESLVKSALDANSVWRRQ